MTPLHFQLVFLLSLVLSLSLTPLFAKLARRFRIVDRPGHRKTHKEPVAYLGGAALALSVTGAFLFDYFFFAGSSDAYTFKGFMKAFFVLFPAMGVGLVGLWDDVSDINPRYKFMGQFLFAVAFSIFGFRFEVLHIPGLPPTSLGLLSIPATVFWILAIVNAFNMIDGVDGLAASVSAASLVLMAFDAGLVGSTVQLILILGLLGAVLGFLPFNWKPAKVYLGDMGSGFLGMFIACSLVGLGQGFGKTIPMNGPTLGQPYFYQIIIATLIVAYPAMEIILSVIRRLLRGRPIWRADKGHIHHRLLHEGWTPQSICLMALALTFLPGFAALTTVAKYHGLATWSLALFGLLIGLGLSTLGFLDFLKPNLIERLRPHYQIAHYFISMQKIKLTLAHSREEVLALVDQTCHELGVKGYRLIVRPDEELKGGLDYTHSFDPTKFSDLEGQPHGPVDHVRLSQGKGGAEWVFEPQSDEGELDVEYRVLLIEFMREALERAAKLGRHQITLEPPSVVAFPQRPVSGHALRKAYKAKNEK